jgi:hypothetical protein
VPIELLLISSPLESLNIIKLKHLRVSSERLQLCSNLDNCVTFMQLSGMWIVKMDSKNAARFDPESWLDSDQPAEWIRGCIPPHLDFGPSTQKRKYEDLACFGNADKRPLTDQCHLRQWQWVFQKALASL